LVKFLVKDVAVEIRLKLDSIDAFYAEGSTPFFDDGLDDM